VAETFDLSDPGATNPPFPAIERLRAAAPVHYLPRNACWIVLGHDEVRTALAEPGIFSSRALEEVDSVLLGADPPDHGAARRLVAGYLMAAAQGQIVERLPGEAAALIAERFDLVADYAVPLTRKATALVVGLDEAEVEAILAAPDIGLPAARMGTRSRDLLRRADLHARLLAEGEALDDEKACSLVRLLCRAATETTERLIIRAMMVLLQDEPLRRRIETRFELLGPFIEEVMRLYPPEPNLVRVTTRDVGLGGKALPAGAPLLLSLLGANRDPRVFVDPGQVRLDRTRAPHLAFGGGVHQCVGAGLGRRIAHIALRALLDWVPRLRAAEALDTVACAVNQGIETPRRLMMAT
jgi:cytochrome P450